MKSLTMIVPAHNEEKNIGKCLDSLQELREHYPGIEVLVGDDGSSDRTGEISRRYPFVKLTRFEERQGKHVMVDYLRKIANGEIIGILDADRRFVCEKGELERLMGCFDDPKVGGMGDYYTTTYDEEKVKHTNDILFLGDSYVTLFMLEFKMERFAKRNDGKLYVPDSGFMFFVNFFRKDAFRKFRTKSLCDDGERTIHLIKNGYKIRLLETEQRPYFKAVYKKMSAVGFFRTKVRGFVAQKQIDKLYGGFSITNIPKTSLIFHIIKNIHRVNGWRAFVGVVWWWVIIVIARLRFLFIEDMDTKEGWGWRMETNGQ